MVYAHKSLCMHVCMYTRAFFIYGCIPAWIYVSLYLWQSYLYSNAILFSANIHPCIYVHIYKCRGRHVSYRHAYIHTWMYVLQNTRVFIRVPTPFLVHMHLNASIRKTILNLYMYLCLLYVCQTIFSHYQKIMDFQSVDLLNSHTCHFYIT